MNNTEFTRLTYFALIVADGHLINLIKHSENEQLVEEVSNFRTTTLRGWLAQAQTEYLTSLREEFNEAATTG